MTLEVLYLWDAGKGRGLQERVKRGEDENGIKGSKGTGDGRPIRVALQDLRLRADHPNHASTL